MRPFDAAYLTKRMVEAYGILTEPLLKETGLCQTAFDILMFLSNHPQYTTARDIVDVRGIKANLVSMNVERLVQLGLLERHPMEEDRRKIRLVVTPKADSITARGRELQRQFRDRVLDGVDEETLEHYRRMLERINENIERLKAERK